MASSVALPIPTRLNSAEIRQALSLSQERLAALLNISPKTVSRWERGEHYPTDAEILRKLAQLKDIADLGSRVYSPPGLKAFLSTPLPVFDGYSAIDLIGLGRFEPVMAALAADFEGIGF